MILDTQTVFSGAVAVDGTRTPQGPITATAISTNVLDVRNNATPALADEALQGGGECWLIVQVIQAFNNLTSLTITLESDSATSLASAPVVHFSKTILLAALTAGATPVRIQLPSDDYKRYLGLRYTVTGAAPTTGTISAFMTFDPQRSITYPGAFTVDV
jgi:hypothetical protein